MIKDDTEIFEDLTFGELVGCITSKDYTKIYKNMTTWDKLQAHICNKVENFEIIPFEDIQTIFGDKLKNIDELEELINDYNLCIEKNNKLSEEGDDMLGGRRVGVGTETQDDLNSSSPSNLLKFRTNIYKYLECLKPANQSEKYSLVKIKDVMLKLLSVNIGKDNLLGFLDSHFIYLKNTYGVIRFKDRLNKNLDFLEGINKQKNIDANVKSYIQTSFTSNLVDIFVADCFFKFLPKHDVELDNNESIVLSLMVDCNVASFRKNTNNNTTHKKVYRRKNIRSLDNVLQRFNRNIDTLSLCRNDDIDERAINCMFSGGTNSSTLDEIDKCKEFKMNYSESKKYYDLYIKAKTLLKNKYNIDVEKTDNEKIIKILNDMAVQECMMFKMINVMKTASQRAKLHDTGKLTYANNVDDTIKEETDRMEKAKKKYIEKNKEALNIITKLSSSGFFNNL